jgi:hypothetical protein
MTPPPVDVRVRAQWVAKVGYCYDVLLDGEMIVSGSRDPGHDAARALHARGLCGRFRTIDFRTEKPRMSYDIEKAAKLRTVERNDTGLIVVAYRPMSEEDKTRARLHRGSQGRRSAAAGASDTRPIGERPGGESGATQRGARTGTDAGTSAARTPAELGGA